MAVDIGDVTNSEVEGRGIFDELMRAGKAQLVEEFDKQRITNNEYANLLLGTVQSAMGQGIQFALQKGIVSRQEELLAEQTKQAIAQTALMTQQLINLAHEDELITAKLLQAAEELTNTQEQGRIFVQQTAKLTGEVLITTKQLAVMDADLLAKAAQTALTNAEVTYSATKNSIGAKQIVKLDGEIALLTQKKFTEEAQTVDTVNGSAVTGVIGKQKALFGKQTDGFDRDAEQKLMKVMFDSWGIRFNSDPATVLPTAFIDAEINKVMTKGRQGIGLT